MAKNVKYGLIVQMKDLATRKLNKVRRSLLNIGKAAKAVGGGRVGAAMAIGGPVGGLLMGLTSGAALAARKITSVVTDVVGTVLRLATGLFKKLAGMVTGFVSGTVGLAKKVGGLVKKVGLIAGGAFVGLTGMSVKWAASFEEAMAEVATIAKKITGPAFEKVKEQVKSLAVLMGKPAVEMARGLYQVISAGFTDAAGSVKLLSVCAKAAIAGLGNMEVVVRTIAGSLNAYGLSTDKAMRVADMFFESIRLGVFRFEEIGHAMGGVTGFGAQLGAGLDELLAAFTALTKANVPIDRASTAIRSALAQILKPTKEAAEAAEAMGIAFGPGALRKMGLFGFLQQVRRATQGRPELLAQLFPNRRALAGILPLLGKQFKMFASDLREIQRAAGTTEGAFVIMADTLTHRARQFWQQIKKTAMAYGEPLLKPLGRIFDLVRKKFRALEEPARRVSTVLAEALDSLIDFATSREWTFATALQGIKDAAKVLSQDIQDAIKDLSYLFAFKWEGKWRMGPLTAGLVDAFRIAIAEIEGLFKQLWDVVLSDLRGRIAATFTDIFVNLNQEALAVYERGAAVKARKRYELVRTGRRLLGTAKMPPWHKVPEEEREALRRKTVPGAATLAKMKALQGLAGAFVGAGKAIGAGRVPESERAARLQEIQAEKTQRVNEALESFRRNLDFVGQGLRSAAGQFGGTGVMPGAPAAPPALDPYAQKLLDTINRKKQLESLLAKTGHAELAIKLADEINELCEQFTTYMETNKQAHESAAKHVKALSAQVSQNTVGLQRLKRMFATARA